MGHGGVFWQNMVHWRREWQTTSVFLPWEPNEQYKKAKRTLKDELPRLVGTQYATGDQWRNHSRKNEERKWVAQSCPTLCNPMDCSLSGSSVHGIFQARVLEWIAISFSNLPDPGTGARSPALQADALPSESEWREGDKAKTTPSCGCDWWWK